jgi:c-di-GMP-binding flagellar brake protein YcgR
MLSTPFLSSHRISPRGTQRYARILFSTPITLQYLTHGGIRRSRGVSLDISEGGLGALVEGSLDAGNTVSLDVKLPNFELKAVAIVRYSSSLRSGFEFVGLTAEERQRLAGFVASA